MNTNGWINKNNHVWIIIENLKRWLIINHKNITIIVL
jgi:hypothetical protein